MINKNSHHMRVDRYVLLKDLRQLKCKNKLCLEHVTKNSSYNNCKLYWEGRSWRSEGFFVKHFLQLNFILLTFFSTWHCCIVILTFPNDIILYCLTAIPLDIELKMNVYKTTPLRLVSITMRRIIKTCAIKQILLNNIMFKINNKYTTTRREISPSLRIKIKSLACF